MALPPAPTVTDFHIVATVVPGFALIISIFRLIYRYKRNLSWWDDALVGAASMFMILLVVGVWLFTAPAKAHLSQTTKVAAYYLSTYMFTCANYCARLSILFGIMRIAPNPTTRRLLRFVAAFFVVVLAVLLAQKIWVCDGGDRSWKKEEVPSCHLGLQVAITELVTDIVCDAILVVTPLKFLAGARLKPSQKRRIYAIFLASVATTIVSIVQDWLILRAGGLREITASMIEVAVSIIVANLPVIVSVVFRLFNRDAAANSATTRDDASRRPRQNPLTSSSDPNSRRTIQLTEMSHKTKPSVVKLQYGKDELQSWEDKRTTGRETDYDMEVDIDVMQGIDKYGGEIDERPPFQHRPTSVSFAAEVGGGGASDSGEDTDRDRQLHVRSPTHPRYPANMRTEQRQNAAPEPSLVRVEVITGGDDDDDEGLPARFGMRRAPSAGTRLRPGNVTPGVLVQQHVIVTTDPLPPSPRQSLSQTRSYPVADFNDHTASFETR